jgi:hypothetical protein
MLNTLKSLVAKSWKNEKPDLDPGTHYFDEEFVVRISGSVEQRPDELIAPTVSIPLIPALALFWEKAGIARKPALEMLKQALLEAMDKGSKEDPDIQARIKDIETKVLARQARNRRRGHQALCVRRESKRATHFSRSCGLSPRQGQR